MNVGVRPRMCKRSGCQTSSGRILFVGYEEKQSHVDDRSIDRDKGDELTRVGHVLPEVEAKVKELDYDLI